MPKLPSKYTGSKTGRTSSKKPSKANTGKPANLPSVAKAGKQEAPNNIKPYLFHGVALEDQGNNEWTGDCPFCGTESKFTVNQKNGRWRCFVCQAEKQKGGGVTGFLNYLHHMSYEATPVEKYQELAKERNLDVQALLQWEFAISVTTGNWIVPAFDLGSERKLYMRQLYRLINTGKRKALIPTPARGHAVFGLQLSNTMANVAMVCEGPWDAIKLYTELGKHKRVGDHYQLAGAGASTVLTNHDVVAIATCSTWVDNLTSALEGKDVVLCFDSDHPKTNEKTGLVSPPAGLEGVERIAGKIGTNDNRLMYLKWGEAGYDPDLPTGYDVRDLFRDSVDGAEGLAQLFDMLANVPNDWRTVDAEDQVQAESCDDWNELVESWNKAISFTDGLEYGLAVMLACISSTTSIGDQLWIKVIGPPSCGKSTLCEAVSIARKHVVAKSTIRGFLSGFGAPGGKGKDNSLIVLIAGKSLVTKDGDTLLTSPNLGQILSEARDLYDGCTRSHYRHGGGRDYEGIRMTWILCGTHSLRSIDSSELGQRFLDCVIMHDIDPAVEEEILIRKAKTAARNAGTLTDGKANTQHDPEMLRAMAMTAGYVEHLNTNAPQQLGRIAFPDEWLIRCTQYGKLISFMRARPSKNDPDTASRELAARLVSQITRLAKMLAYVLQKESVDKEVMKLVERCTLDTSRGVVLSICRRIRRAGEAGMATNGVALHAGMTNGDCRSMLQFMRQIDALALMDYGNEQRWVLSDQMTALMDDLEL